MSGPYIIEKTTLSRKAPTYYGKEETKKMNFLQRWSWIPRRQECGTPCQSCRYKCEYQAIEETGKVNYSECFQCLDCVSIYQDPKRCLPLIKQTKADKTIIPVHAVKEL